MSQTNNPATPPKVDAVRAMELLAEVSAAPTMVRVGQAMRELRGYFDSAHLVRLRVGCLASFTFNPMSDVLRLQGLRAGFAIEPYIAPYGQFDRELIDPGSGLAASNPDVVLLAIRLPDAVPGLYEAFNSLTAESAGQLVEDWFARLKSSLLSFRARSAAHILIQDYESPLSPALGLADRSSKPSQLAIIADANERLRRLAKEISNVRVMEYDALVARYGRQHWADPRMALYARIPVAPANYWALAGFYVRHLRPLYGLSKKVLVLDADHTLWGGVVGDVGTHGITLGPDYPGNGFVAFQKRILELYRRGVVLCIASKNEEATVLDVLRNHPAMVLKEEHFAAMRINWQPKPENIQAMARDLNLGLDSFVFLDDSPIECEMVRRALPQVMTVCVPKEAAEMAGVIDALDCFDQFSISAEDRERGSLYRAEAGRRELQSAVVDLPTFYRQLDMVMTLRVNDPADVARAAQMSARTNQFNMHTIRHSEDDIRRFMSGADHQVVTLALKDRFGDNGVVGLAIIRKSGDEWILHGLLMSCRILGRTVEECFIKWIAEQARAAGAKRLVGEYVPTSKNKPFSGFYAARGFSCDQPDAAVQRWEWTLANADTTMPDWMKLEIEERGARA